MKAYSMLLLVPSLALAQFTGPTVPSSAGVTVVSSLTTCSSPARGNLEFLTSNSSTYVCNGSNWLQVLTDEDSQKVSPNLIITPWAVVPQAGPGQAAFKVGQTGARIYFDVGGNIYCASDGSQVVCASAWMIPTVSTDTIGSFTANRVVDIFNPHVFPTSSLGTCNGSSSAGSVPEGTIKVQSGSSLSAQSRVCACVSDGAGTPAFTWVNTGCPNTAGTSTTCPACP